MSKMHQFVAFRGLIRLIKKNKAEKITKFIKNVKRACLMTQKIMLRSYILFSYEEVSQSITELVKQKILILN